MQGFSVCEVRRLARYDGTLWPFMLVDGFPLILPNLWIDDLGLTVRPNTLEAYLRDLLILYKWALENGVKIEERIRGLTGFSKCELRNIARVMSTKSDGKVCSKSTISRRVQSIYSFFDFAFSHFIEIDKVSISIQQFAENNKCSQKKRLGNLMGAHANKGMSSRNATVLSVAEVDLVKSILHPMSDLNPFFDVKIKFRNYCIFLVLLETLARRSELVLFEIDDLSLDINPTITIKEPTVLSKVRRKDGASMKTLGRTVPISRELAAILNIYVQDYRDDFLFVRRPSKALFLSGKDGRRLNSNTLNKILNKIQELPEIRAIGFRIHPHGIRSTSANQIRRMIQDAGHSSDIDIVEALSYLGGWKQNSPMVQHYTKIAISERLGKILREKRGGK